MSPACRLAQRRFTWQPGRHEVKMLATMRVFWRRSIWSPVQMATEADQEWGAPGCLQRIVPLEVACTCSIGWMGERLSPASISCFNLRNSLYPKAGDECQLVGTTPARPGSASTAGSHRSLPGSPTAGLVVGQFQRSQHPELGPRLPSAASWQSHGTRACRSKSVRAGVHGRCSGTRGSK